MRLTCASRPCSSLISYILLPLDDGLLLPLDDRLLLGMPKPMAWRVRQHSIHECYIHAKSPYLPPWSLCSRAHGAWRRVGKGWLVATEWVIQYIWLVKSSAEVTMLWAFTVGTSDCLVTWWTMGKHPVCLKKSISKPKAVLKLRVVMCTGYQDFVPNT